MLIISVSKTAGFSPLPPTNFPIYCLFFILVHFLLSSSSSLLLPQPVESDSYFFPTSDSVVQPPWELNSQYRTLWWISKHVNVLRAGSIHCKPGGDSRGGIHLREGETGIIITLVFLCWNIESETFSPSIQLKKTFGTSNPCFKAQIAFQGFTLDAKKERKCYILSLK